MMKHSDIIPDQEFRKELLQLALPVTLQCLLQSSFGVIDQVMTGQLGSVSIAGIGLAGKFISLLTVMVQAITAVAGIIIAQAIGKNDRREAGKGFYTNLLLALFLTAGFTAISLLMPEMLMNVYSKDGATVAAAASYLRIYAISFLPMMLTAIVSAYLRCEKAAMIPLYAGICAAVLNTVLNYLLIFGKFGFPQMGVRGAAWASVISQAAGCAVVVMIFLARYGGKERLSPGIYRKSAELKVYLGILVPMLICEFLWVLGENVYAFIYGHMGTEACAAMTLINPVVALMIGALSGVAQATGIMVGKCLGAGEREKAYHTAGKLMKTGFWGSAALSVLLLLIRPYYVRIFNVEPEVRAMTSAILAAFAVVAPLKVQNMILGGGVLRSGGKTEYVMVIDLIGTWMFGVPLGLLTAFVLKLPIVWVYFILSLEECVRLLISAFLFRRKKWMRRL